MSAEAGSAGGSRRIGIFGGTFNPPHIGHLICAESAADELGLDSVLLIPTGTPPHKEVPGDPGARIRLELAEVAAAGNPRLVVSGIEVERDGPSYTVDTLRAIAAENPDAEIVLIIGGDMALGFAEWHMPDAIAELATIAVVERAGIDRSAIAGALMRFGGARVVTFTMPRCDVSSTEIRARIADGRSVRYLVPAPVLDMIGERGLYGLS